MEASPLTAADEMKPRLTDHLCSSVASWLTHPSMPIVLTSYVSPSKSNATDQGTRGDEVDLEGRGHQE